MKLTFLGTSHGVPAKDRYCSCTMLELNGSIYLIDAGAPIIDILIRRGIDLNRIRAIFTTHIHGDHTNGLFAFLNLCNWYFKDTALSVYLTEEAGIELFRKSVATMEMNSQLDDTRLKLLLMTPETVYDDEIICLRPIPTEHLRWINHPSYAYLIEAEGKRLLFTGDLSKNLEYNDFPEIAMREPIDLVISEMAHFGVEQLKPMLDNFCGKRLLFNHVFPYRQFDDIENLKTRYPYEIGILSDGDEIEL